MSCRDMDDLLALEAAGVLEEGEMGRLEEHRDDCPRCRGFGRELASVYQALSAPLPERRVDREAFWEKLSARMDSATPRAEEDPGIAIQISLSCRYCHDGLDRSEACYCASCLAPHHIDCFRAHGRCTALGCDETFTVTPDRRFTPPPRRRRRFGLIFGGLFTAGIAAAAFTGFELYQRQRARYEQELSVARKRLPIEAALKQEIEQLSADREQINKDIRALKPPIEIEARLALQARCVELERAIAEKTGQLAVLQGKAPRQDTVERELKSDLRKHEDRISQLNDTLLAEQRRFDTERRSLKEQIHRLMMEKDRADRINGLRDERLAARRRLRERQAKTFANTTALREYLSGMTAERRAETLDEITGFRDKYWYLAPVIADELAHADAGVRLAAIKALTAFGPKGRLAAPAVVRALQDDELLGPPTPLKSYRLALNLSLPELELALVPFIPELLALLKAPSSSVLTAIYPRSLSSLRERLAVVEFEREHRRSNMAKRLAGSAIDLALDSASFTEAFEEIERLSRIPINLSEQARLRLEKSQDKRLHNSLKQTPVLTIVEALCKASGLRSKVCCDGILLAVEGEAALASEQRTWRGRTLASWIEALDKGLEDR